MANEDMQEPQEPELKAKEPRELTQEELERLRREETEYWAQLSNVYGNRLLA